MTERPTTTTPGEDVRVAGRRMVDGRVKRLPVVDGDRLVGILSRSDLLGLLHRSDDDIQQDVDRMLADPRRAPERHDVTASVSNGVVTLRGAVEYPMDLPVLMSFIWQVAAVVSIDMKATPRRPDPTVGS